MPRSEGLPIVWVDTWEEVTPVYLERTWARLLAKPEAAFDMRRLYPPFWLAHLLHLDVDGASLV